MKTPSATIKLLDGSDRIVAFDFGLLEQIETRVGKSVTAIAVELSEPLQAAKGDTEEGKQKIAAAVRLGPAVRFVAACLGVTTEELGKLIPMRGFLGHYLDLFNPFISAVNALVSDEAEPDASPSDPQPGSGPGLLSNSDSAGASSSGSGPASSPNSDTPGSTGSGGSTTAPG